MSSNRRVTLGPVTSSQMNARLGSGLGGSAMGSELAAKTSTRRMSMAAMPQMSRMSIGGPGMSAMAIQSSRMSIGGPGAALPGMAGAARRASVGVSRKSSVAPRGSTLDTKRVVDTRNIGDKQFMNSSIRTLIQYLTEHGFEHALSSKILTRPAVKDFHNIVMFLFRQLDPNLQCTGKFEDEVVTVFKHLGYPVQISKANIAAVGSPHAWPSLLASVMWLIELLAYDEAAAAGAAEQLEAELEDPSSYKAFYEYVATSYALFLSGEDVKYAELERQFVEQFESKNFLAQQQIDGLVETNAALHDEIKQVEGRRAYLPELEARKRDYEKDLGKFQQLIEQLTAHRDQLTTKAGAREAELERLTASVATVQSDMAALRDRISNQELSPEDVRSMVAERERLEESQRQANETRQAIQRKVWETETALRDRVQALEDSTRAYNSIAEDLKLVPHTAKNAHGKHYALEVNVQAKKGARLVKTDVRRDIQPALVDLRVKLESTTSDYRNDLMKEQDEAEELELRRASTLEQRVVAESKLRRAEEAYKREKEALDQASEVHSKEMETMEARLLRLRDTAAEEARATAAARRTAELRAAREARRAEHARTKRDMMDAIMEAVAQCASHREMVQQRLGDLKGTFGQKLQQLLMGDASAVPPSASRSVLRSAERSRALNDSQLSAAKPAPSMQLFAGEEEEEEDGLEGLQLQEDEEEPERGQYTGRPSMRPLTLENIMLNLSS